MALLPLPDEAEAALRRFRQFYEQLFAIKHALREGDWAALVGGRPEGETVEMQVARSVQLRLRRAIAAQGFGGPVAAGAPAGVDPGYVMAAVADEALLHDVPWPGRDGWAETPLEQVLYRSRLAGDRIFQAISELTGRRAPDADGTAMTILLALELGFRGRYRASDVDVDAARRNDGEIEREKSRLYMLIFRARYEGMEERADLLVGAQEPLATRAPVRLPRLRPWLAALGGIVAGYLVLSWLIWLREVSDVVDSAGRFTAALHALR